MALDKGFAELVSGGLAERQPRLVGVRADRCQPLVRAWLGAPAGPAELDPAATVADGIAGPPAIGDAARSWVAEQTWRRPGWGDHHLSHVPGSIDPHDGCVTSRDLRTVRWGGWLLARRRRR